MCGIIGVGERLHKVFGLIDLGTLDSGERSLPFGLLVFLLEMFCGLRDSMFVYFWSENLHVQLYKYIHMKPGLGTG